MGITAILGFLDIFGKLLAARGTSHDGTLQLLSLARSAIAVGSEGEAALAHATAKVQQLVDENRGLTAEETAEIETSIQSKLDAIANTKIVPAIVAALVACLLAFAPAHRAAADTNMVQICTNTALVGHVAQDCIKTLKWDVPVPSDLVLTRPASNTTSSWDNMTTWQIYSTLGGITPPVTYRTCTADLPRPSFHGNGVGDPCAAAANAWVAPSIATPPETHTLIITPASTKEDGSVLLPGEIKAHHIQCGLGSNTGPWIIDDELTMPAVQKDYSFPVGQWNCHAWTVANYQCPTQAAANCISADTGDLLFGIPMLSHKPPGSPTLTIK